MISIRSFVCQRSRDVAMVTDFLAPIVENWHILPSFSRSFYVKSNKRKKERKKKTLNSMYDIGPTNNIIVMIFFDFCIQHMKYTTQITQNII